MKEEFIRQRVEEIANMSDAEYQDWCHSREITGIPNGDTMSDTDDDCCGGDCHCEGEPVTQEESQSNHDAWWDSLTDEQKQQLYDDKTESNDEYLNHWLKKDDNESK